MALFVLANAALLVAAGSWTSQR